MAVTLTYKATPIHSQRASYEYVGTGQRRVSLAT